MKKLLCSVFLLLPIVSHAASETDRQTLAEVVSSQPAGYTFSSWQSDMKCTFKDRTRIYTFTATRGTVPPVVRKSETTTPVVGTFTPVNSNITGGGTWSTSTYTPPTTASVAVPMTASNGGYTFNYTSESGSRTVILFPSGFYVTQLGRLYLPGC